MKFHRIQPFNSLGIFFIEVATLLFVFSAFCGFDCDRENFTTENNELKRSANSNLQMVKTI